LIFSQIHNQWLFRKALAKREEENTKSVRLPQPLIMRYTAMLQRKKRERKENMSHIGIIQ
jgi:hypothetical protein